MKYLLVMFLILSMISCASIQPQIAKFDDANAKVTMDSAKQIMKHAKMNIAAIHESLDDFKPQMPVAFWTALDKLEGFSNTYGNDQSKMTEQDAGRIVVLVGKLFSPIVQQLVKQYVPDLWTQILKWLPTFLAM